MFEVFTFLFRPFYIFIFFPIFFAILTQCHPWAQAAGPGRHGDRAVHPEPPGDN